MSLDEYRDQIDQLDNQLIVILGKRFNITRQVGEYKRQHNLTSRDPNREKHQFTRYEKLAVSNQINPVLVARIMRSIVDEVVVNHNQLRNQD